MGSSPSQSKTSGFQDKCSVSVTVQEQIGVGQVLYYSHMHSHIFVSKPDKASPLSCSMRWSLFPMKATILSCPWSSQITGHDCCYQLRPFTQKRCGARMSAGAGEQSCIRVEEGLGSVEKPCRGGPYGLAFKNRHAGNNGIKGSLP